MAPNRISIAIAEHAPIISAGLSHTLSRLPSLPVRVIEINGKDDLRKCLDTEEPDILVVSPFFGGGFDLNHTRVNYPHLKVIAIATAPLDRKTRESFDDVISIADDVESITEKVRFCSNSRIIPPDDKEPLSTREKEIITHVVKGMTNKEIADKLFLSVHTVITHRRNIARKLEIHSATGLTIYAIVNKLIDISDLHYDSIH